MNEGNKTGEFRVWKMHIKRVGKREREKKRRKKRKEECDNHEEEERFFRGG